MPGDDAAVRAAAFLFLDQVRQVHRDGVPRDVLVKGFEFQGRRVPLMGPKGIFKPAVLHDAPLSITTIPPSDRKPAPYDDTLADGDLLHYRYRGTDPSHPDNAGLRRAWQQQIPLIYFFGLVEGRYLPVYPAYVVRDDPASLTFSVAIDDRRVDLVPGIPNVPAIGDDIRRRYVTAAVQVRLHQQAFRERVLRAYQEHCAVCRLRHRELLDAAHILADAHERGDPLVSNGLALCRLHHAAFDTNILGVTPDYVIEIRTDVLEEVDGPMLVHGLQGFQGARLGIPSRPDLQPDRERLAERYEAFRRAG
jgi:putative restriction endonuclease